MKRKAEEKAKKELEKTKKGRRAEDTSKAEEKHLVNACFCC